MIIDVKLTKVCTKCGVEKGVSDYSKQRAECKCCRVEQAKAYRLANKEAIAERKKEHYQANKEVFAEQRKERYQANKDVMLEQRKAYYEAHKEVLLDQMKVYRITNKEAIAERKKIYYRANKEAVCGQVNAYQKANPHLVNAIKAKRRASKKNATPSWADLEAIKGMYELAAIFNRTGINLHVDHVIPLQSDLVCGLHCEANLQLLQASDNASKGNRHWPDMPV
jgi:hypothetical protein